MNFILINYCRQVPKNHSVVYTAKKEVTLFKIVHKSSYKKY